MKEKMDDFWQNKPNTNRWWVYGLVIALGLSVGMWQGVAKKNPAQNQPEPGQPGLIGAKTIDLEPMGAQINQLQQMATAEKNNPKQEKIAADSLDAEENQQPQAPAEAKTVGVSAAAPTLLIPASGKWDRGYGYGYDDTLKDYRFHNGADMPLSLGELVFCALDGKISAVGENDYEGQFVIVEHENNMVTKYYGIETDWMVGDTLKTGEVIGKVVASPLFETEQIPHLHFELWIDGAAADPLLYIK